MNILNRRSFFSLSTRLTALCVVCGHIPLTTTAARQDTMWNTDLLSRYANDPVKYEYIKQGLLRTEREVRLLHQFYSPDRIPPGMTRSEIETCIGLHSAHETHSMRVNNSHPTWVMVNIEGEAHLLPMSNISPRLPAELSGPDPMTRGKFHCGVNKLVTRLHELSN